MPLNISNFISNDFKSHHSCHERRNLEIPDLLVCDTWSDLVHQKFQINGQTLYCNYVELSKDSKSKQISMGRLDLISKSDSEQYVKNYLSLFELGIKYIIMVDFPAIYDARIQMRMRSKHLTRCCMEIERLDDRFKFIQIPYDNIFLKKSLKGYSRQRLLGDNPVGDAYHFSDSTVSKATEAFDKCLEEMKA